MQKNTTNNFEKFTNQYSLSKTLRFEIVPTPETRELMDKNLEYDKDLQTFLIDQEIEDAYQTLKPVFDKIHEDFINRSLESKHAREIDFSEYFEKYKNRKSLDDSEISGVENGLRAKFADAYDETAGLFKNEVGKDDKNKQILKEKGFEVLTESGILKYIENNKKHFSDIRSKEEIQSALDKFKGFFTYFGGFNQNRENYYETKKEAATAVATRIVHENLPKFCDNVLRFESRKDEYLAAFDYLRSIGNVLQDRDGNSLYPIEEAWFSVSNFNNCLSQEQIEEYNKRIGNSNFIINLYNQAKKKGGDVSEKLKPFTTLYKQIGCGKRDSLFYALKYDRKGDYEKQDENEVLSVEEVSELAAKTGEKYFSIKTTTSDEIQTIADFINYILSRDNYLGIYWSKIALSGVSNKYFANWHTLKDKLKEAKVFSKNKKSDDDEDVKIPEAVELEGFFAVLDSTVDEWKKEGIFFKKSIFEARDKNDEENKIVRKQIIDGANRPSEALLKLIVNDLKNHAKEFVGKSNEVLKLEKYSDETSKEIIKLWLDEALAVTRILKYFVVKPTKAKGNPIDSTLDQGLRVLLHSEDATWFKWYDATRNYLTKKPQDDVKENKLKLNFENGQLMGGWSDGQEKNKGAVLLRKDGIYYLGILKKKSIFNTEKENNEVYKNPTPMAGRLILANLKFQTLAGKGFLGEFKQSYGEMGKTDPIRAISSLQKIITDRYGKYPLLKKITEVTYTDKKKFDADIKETLLESYICEFKSINWEEVEKFVEQGEMYLFEIRNNPKKLQASYWNEVFREGSYIQLNGGAEIFFRRKAVHEKKTKVGYESKSHVIESKRFTEEKFLFHCPIKINYKAKNYTKPVFAVPEINTSLNRALSTKPDTLFLGIDRGEKHLAYYSLIKQDGKIIEQNSLNMPFLDTDGNLRKIKVERQDLDDNGKIKTEIVECSNYNELLEARAGNRDFARKNWKTIGTIKELKDGYISQVVRKIVDLAVDKNRETPSFIVLENLNVGFKRGRQKIEKSVYQKLELALAKKLNFLVNKKAVIGEVGSVSKALQLTPPVNNFGDIEGRMQFGIMLYTKADYTSQTDPVTGWRKSIYLKKGNEESVKQQIDDNFKDIGFDGKDYYFDYVVKHGKYEKPWRLYSGSEGVSLDRFRGKRDNDKNQWISTKEDVVAILDGVFEGFDRDRSLLSQLIDEGITPKKINEHTGWESLRYAIDLIQQIRNTGTSDRDSDFIMSPVRNDNGEHFDSRIYWDKEKSGEKAELPSSGDANGAYNIARKGVIMNEHLKLGFGLLVRDEEWSAWLAGREFWESWVKDNEKLLKLKNKKTKQK